MLRRLMAVLTLTLCVTAHAEKPQMAIDNGGTMEFIHAVRAGKLTPEQQAALDARLRQECAQPTNPITQGMIETRGPGKCLAFVRHQCSCTDCDMPTYCLPAVDVR